MSDGPEAADAPGPDTIEVLYTVPHAPLFRVPPASAEGPPERWQVARLVIDFGAALLTEMKTLRNPGPIRDAVLAALLRRALITAEGIWWLLARGLEEPAFATFRTLLDVELNLRLICGDASDRMAKKFAAFHYYGYQKHGQKMLGNTPTRTELIDRHGDTQRTVGVAKSYARFLEQPIFDDVRDEVRGARVWHGFDSVEAAFASVGMASDYYTNYDSATFFVHDTNVDADFAEVTDTGLALKAVVQRDPKVTHLHLGNLVARMLTIYDVYVGDRGLPESFQERGHGGESTGDERQIRLNSLDGLRMLVAEQFDSVAGVENPFASDAGAP